MSEQTTLFKVALVDFRTAAKTNAGTILGKLIEALESTSGMDSVTGQGQYFAAVAVSRHNVAALIAAGARVLDQNLSGAIAMELYLRGETEAADDVVTKLSQDELRRAVQASQALFLEAAARVATIAPAREIIRPGEIVK